MIHFPLRVLLPLAVAELALAGGLFLLARGLGRRLPARVLAIGGLVPWLLLAPWLFGDRLLVPTALLGTIVPGAETDATVDIFDRNLNDAVLQFLPWELEVRHALARGRLPFWSDLVDGGCDLWANPQAQVLAPTAMLARGVGIEHHLLVGLILKWLIAGSGAWLLARALGVRSRAAAIAAASYAVGGALVPWAVFPHSAAAAWLPWVVLGTLTLARRPRPGAFVATALATAALMLSGQPEVAMSGVFLGGLAALALRAKRLVWWRAIGAPCAAGLLGVALAAPIWLPFVDLAATSQRAHELERRQPSLADMRALEPASWFGAQSARYLRGPLHPMPYWPDAPGAVLDLRWHWTYNAAIYLGLAALAGIALALLAPLPRRFAPFLAFWLLCLLAVADFKPLERFLQALPGLRWVENSRFLPAGCLAGAMVAACGLELLLGGRRRGRAALAIVGAAAASCLAGPPHLVLAGWLAIAAAAALAARPGRSARLAFAALLAALALDLAPWATSMLPRGEGHHFYPRTAFMALVQREAAAPAGPWRTVGDDRAVFPNLLPTYGVGDPRPHNPLAPQAQIDVLAAAFGYAETTSEYFGQMGHLDHPLLDFLGVRNVVLAPDRPIPPAMHRVDRGEADPWPVALLRNDAALPRWFLPTAVDRVTPERLRDWIAGLDDGRRVAIPSGAAAGLPSAPRPWAPDAVTSLDGRPGRARLRVAGEGERLLATSFPGPTGWRASAGDRRLETLAVDGAYLGVVVPAGVDTVELRFVPPWLGLGMALASLALLILGGIAWRARAGAKSAPRRMSAVVLNEGRDVA